MIKRLELFLGEWEAEAVVDGVVVARERVAYEWIEDSKFLVQRADGTLTEAAPEVWCPKTGCCGTRTSTSTTVASRDRCGGGAAAGVPERVLGRCELGRAALAV